MRRKIAAVIQICMSKISKRKADVYQPPHRFNCARRKVFLAGSIDMGKAEDWQARVIDGLSDLNITIMNPRCDDFDPDLRQDIEEPAFTSQVNWELDMLEIADVIPMYYDPQGKAPISLLELGLFARSGKLIVCCPEGFWRRGNVQIVCQRYGVQWAETIDHLIEQARERLVSK